MVDRAASRIDRYPTYEIMQWPSFLRSAVDRMSHRLFGVADMLFDVFVGERVKAEFDAAGLTGLQFATADWTNDLGWTPEPRNEEETWSAALGLASSASWRRGVPV